jgi:hypothetical protein
VPTYVSFGILNVSMQFGAVERNWNPKEWPRT